MSEKSTRTYGNFITSCHDAEAHKKVMAKLEDSNETKKWLLDYNSRHQKIERMIIEKFHPEHVDHTYEEIEIEHMFNLFLEKKMKCSCGSIFAIDRDMYILDEKMQERLK